MIEIARTIRLNTKESSKRLNEVHGIECSPKYLTNMRSTGDGPAFEKVLGRVYYRPEWIDAWVDEMSSPKVNSTAELSQCHNQT